MHIRGMAEKAGYLIFGQAAEFIINNDSLARWFMNHEFKCGSQGGKSSKENSGAIFGVHLKVKKDFQIIQDSILI